ncbi:DegT/DnrJ/EryC1/StrS family aminotransferase [Acidimicrobiaceae bacterium]|nr:DegT/DnrJ/EryC1/StrS family aminotransferase [Acidimicrobiaceae bacterium]
MINFNETYLSSNLEKYLIDISKTNSFNSNYYRDKCSEYLSSKFNYNYFLLTHSATAALEISAMVLRNDSQFNDSDVYMPSYTFSSTANAFLRSNFNIKFLDIDPKNMMVEINNIDFKKGDIFVPVHYGGSYFDFDKFYEVNNASITVIEDAAQAFGVTYKNQAAGTFGRMSCFSFHPTKNIHSGFGGLIVFNDIEDFEYAKYIYERGTDRNDVVSGQKKKYEWVSLGSSFEMTELSSAVLLSQFDDFEIITKIKKEIYETYLENLNELIEIGKIKIQSIPDYIRSNHHSFYIIIEQKNDQLIEYLYQNNVKAYIGYIPLHDSKFGKKQNLNSSLKYTELYHDRLIRLPSHPNLTISDVKKICNLIKDFLN